MHKVRNRVGLAIWLLIFCGTLFWFAGRLSSQKQLQSVEKEKKLIGSGHLAAIYRITWPSDTLPKWDPRAEHDFIRSLPWKGVDKSSLTIALHDPSATVALLDKKEFRDGMEFLTEEKDNAQYLTSSQSGWSDPESKFREAYKFSLISGIVRMGWISDVWTRSGHVQGSYPMRQVIVPGRYEDGNHELVKLPNGKYERRIYVIAIS